MPASHMDAWIPGTSAPQDHPQWSEQIELEMEMTQRGADKFRTRVADAKDPGMKRGRSGQQSPEMTRLRAYHHKLEEMVPDVEKHLKAWLFKCKKKPGAVPLAFPYLREMDPAVCAFIAVRTIMDSAGVAKTGLLGVARQIGLEVEYEARMASWLKEAPDLFYSIKDDLKKQKATSKHVRRVNINRFNTLMRDKVDWQDWPADIRRQVGLRLIDVVVVATRAFEIVPDPAHGSGDDDRIARRRPKYLNPQYIVAPSSELLDSLISSIDHDEVRCPVHLPTLMPPKRWEGTRNGGYYSPLLHKPTLIRFHADSEEVRGKALQEYDALEMPRVYSALNYVQEVPWRVNRRILKVAMEIWDRDLGIAGITKQEKTPLPPKPVGMDRPDLKGQDRKLAEREFATDNPNIVKDWKRQAAGVYGENARRVSKAQAVRTTIEIAEKFVSKEFYFPHMLDFRGRMYPIPVYLQPQGNDLSRGLLTFAKGQEVGEEGGEWLAIHLANNFKCDKMSYHGRIQWVKDNEDVWRAIAADPLRCRMWITETDDKHHWQGLAAVFEWVRYLDEGPTMVSSLPIHVDGTCNGIQHLSAMMRDEVGGASVNLYPSDGPRDIYQEVADKLQERLESIRKAGGRMGEYAGLWLDTFERKVGRDFTKSPVMVTPYGGTRDSYYGSVLKWLTKKAPKTSPLVRMMSNEETRKEVTATLVPWIVKHLEDAVKAIVVKGRECMKWLKDVAAVVAETHQPLVWRTPSGFHVRHFYGKLKQRNVVTTVDGKRINLVNRNRTAELARDEQLRGISPNFVHSMDASANMETIISMALDNTQPPITTIHDAYGTVAGAMWKLFAAVRGAFVKVHVNDVLNDYRNACVNMLRDHLLATREGLDWRQAMEKADDMIAQVPKRGSLDIAAVMHSDYFFA